jgi:hypothetical protein
MWRSRSACTATALLVLALAACAPAAGDDGAVDLTLETLNGSGVEGHVRLTPLDDERTLVEIEVDPGRHENMPAHIHPGSCEELVPQPEYALENVVDGVSSTEVRATVDDLLRGDRAVNLHRSNHEMDVYTACVDLS